MSLKFWLVVFLGFIAKWGLLIGTIAAALILLVTC